MLKRKAPIIVESTKLVPYFFDYQLIAKAFIKIIEEPLPEGFEKALEKPKKRKSISGFKIKIPIKGIESLLSF